MSDKITKAPETLESAGALARFAASEGLSLSATVVGAFLEHNGLLPTREPVVAGQAMSEAYHYFRDQGDFRTCRLCASIVKHHGSGDGTPLHHDYSDE